MKLPKLKPAEWLGDAHGVKRPGLDAYIDQVVIDLSKMDAFRDIGVTDAVGIQRALLREAFYLLAAINSSMSHYDLAGLDAIRAGKDGKCVIPTFRDCICELFGIPNPYASNTTKGPQGIVPGHGDAPHRTGGDRAEAGVPDTGEQDS